MEFKHIIFILSVLGIIPLTYLLMFSQRSMKICVFLTPVILIKYQETAINFFTNREYKGTALGYEISLIHLIAIALLLAMLLRRWPIKVLFPGNILYFIFFITCTLSLTSTPNTLYSGFELMKMITIFIVALAITNYLYITHDFDTFLNGIACVILVSFFFAFKEKYFGSRVQVPGIFPHQNSAGMFMCLLGPVFLSRLLNKKDNFIKIGFYLLVFLTSFLATLFTYSRGSLACFPIGCAIVIILSISFHFNFKTIIVIFVIAALSVFSIIYSAPRIINRFVNAPQSSADTRKQFAETAMNIIKDKPLFGCGINTWSIVANQPKYNRYLGTSFLEGNEYLGIVETVYLLVGAECGLLGLGSLLLWYFYYLFQSIFQGYQWRKTELFYLLAGLAGGLTANYLQSTLEWVLKQQINFCTLFCCFGIIAILIQGSREHTTLSYLELYALKREEYLKQLEMAAAAAAEEEAGQAEQLEQPEQPIPEDRQNPPTI